MKNPVVLFGLGEMGGAFARGFLRCGYMVLPVTRNVDPSKLEQQYPKPLLVLLAVAEKDLAESFDAMPLSWRDNLVLLQNELLPNAWEDHDIGDPTVISIWFEKKKRKAVKVLMPSPVFGPHSQLIEKVLTAINVPVRILRSKEDLISALVLKNVFVLTINTAGLLIGGTTGNLWENNRKLGCDIANEIISLQEKLTEKTLNRKELICGIGQAMMADPDHICKGWAASARLSRVLNSAEIFGIELPVIQSIKEKQNQLKSEKAGLSLPLVPKNPPMDLKNLAILEMLSFIYEDLDLDAIEEKYIELIFKVFSFDKVGLFFTKHKKGLLQGKLCRGFVKGSISSLEIPIEERNLLTKPLITGFPIFNQPAGDDQYCKRLGLTNFAAIPIINKKRVPCWKIKDCSSADCPAYGQKWLRCWLVPDTKCHNGQVVSLSQKINLCNECKIYTALSQNADMVEGVLLIDNSESGTQITNETITLLSGISYAVGIAINNSKLYSRTLRVAIKDDLTGLHNRRYFNERLIDELERAKRYNEKNCILLIDVDHFKTVNDTYGHPRGDQVLCWLGAILREKFRHNDVVARYGGEEFAVLLLNTSKQQAFNLADGVRSFIEKHSPKGTRGISLTCSFGVASYGDDSYTFEGLMSKADKALYFAKSQGRNKVCMA